MWKCLSTSYSDGTKNEKEIFLSQEPHTEYVTLYPPFTSFSDSFGDICHDLCSEAKGMKVYLSTVGMDIYRQ